MRLHSIDLWNFRINLNLAKIGLPSKDSEFYIYEYNGKIRAYLVYREKFSLGSKLVSLRVGSHLQSKFIEDGETKVNGLNCGSKIVSSKYYIAVACPSGNMITVIDSTTKNELCNIFGSQNGNLGSDL